MANGTGTYACSATCCGGGSPPTCSCCSVQVLTFTVTASGFSNNGCTQCTNAVPLRGWARSAWKTLNVQSLSPCICDSNFEQTSNTLLCSAVNQNQGARLEITCDGVNTTWTLKLLASPSAATPPSSMLVRATYSFSFAGVPVDCRGPSYPTGMTLTHVSDDGSCNYPASVTLTHI